MSRDNTTTTTNSGGEICASSLRSSGKISYFIPAILLCLATIITNLLIIITFAWFRNLRKNINNLLILSLSVADLLVPVVMGTIGMVLLVNTGKEYSTNTSYLISPSSVVILISGLTLITMTLDRLVAVQKPLKYSSLVSRATAIKAIALVWLLPTSVGVLSVVLGETFISMVFLYVSFSTIIISIMFTLIISNAVLFHKSMLAIKKVNPMKMNSTKMRQTAATSQSDYRGSQVSIDVSRSSFDSTISDISDVNLHYLWMNDGLPSLITSECDISNNKNIFNFRDHTTLPLPPRMKRSRSNLNLSSSQSQLPPRRERASTTSCLEEGPTKRDLAPLPPSRSMIRQWKKQYLKAKDGSLRCFLCLLFTVIYVSCMLPVTIHFVGLVCNTWCSSNKTFQIFSLLPLVNSLLNPLLYFFKRRDFRKHLRKIATNILKNEKTMN